LKILFQNRFDCYLTPGGDTTQMLKTKEHLEKLGVIVDISLNPNVDLSNYDLVHIFNIMRPFETYLFIKNALSQNTKILMSSIYWDFDEFNKIGRESISLSFLYQNFDEFFVEKLKYLFKRHNIIKGFEKKFIYFFLEDYKKILEKVDLFLPNSKIEGEIIQRRISKNIKYGVVSNAVDSKLFSLTAPVKRDRQFLTIARIDPRKNILNLIRAFENLNYKLDIYGNNSPLHNSYLIKANDLLTKNTKINNYVQHHDLLNLYNKHEIHILPSWLETPGLVQLEAAACGCNIISTIKGSAYEYFGEFATYCEPGSSLKIAEAIHKAKGNMLDPKNMSEFILDNYTWQKTAEQTNSFYESVLNE